MTQTMSITMEVNGSTVTHDVLPMMRLLDFLREKCELTGSKEGCGEGECGACSVFMEDVLVNACLVPVFQAQGRRITTVEGLATKEDLHPVQKAFLKFGGAQCGICTPGMLMASVDLLRKHQRPTREQIKLGLSGNLCRCTGYMKIFDSVEQAALEMN